MADDTLKATITAAIREEMEGTLKAALTEVERQHAAKIKAKVDKAMAAIRGGKENIKKPRKPRADKGTKRIGRGLPKTPAEPKKPEL